MLRPLIKVRLRGGLTAASILLVMLMAASAYAGGTCYSPEQLKAEQLLRLHSELMVITVTCRQDSTGQSLVPAYTGFTKTHLTIIQKAEQTLASYFENSGKGSGITLLDKLRTRLGNEYGQKIADMSAPEFCRQYRDKVIAMNQADSRQIDDEVEHMTASEPSYAKLCPESASHIAKATQ